MAILFVPLLAMQFTIEVNWAIADFLIMGLLLFCTGSIFVLLTRGAKPKRRVVIGLILTAIFLLLWAELGVGIFTDLGS